MVAAEDGDGCAARRAGLRSREGGNGQDAHLRDMHTLLSVVAYIWGICCGLRASFACVVQIDAPRSREACERLQHLTNKDWKVA